MVRPSDWYLVGLDGDPTPGDGFGIRQVARKYSDIAYVAAGAASLVRGMRSSGASEAWVGDAGEVFRSETDRMPGELSKADDSYSLVAGALTAWASALEDAQAQADRGLALARDAHADLEAAQSALGEAQRSWSMAHAQQLAQQRLQKKYRDVPPPPDVIMPTEAQLRATSRNVTQSQASMDAASAQVASANARLEAAKRLVMEAKAARDDAEATAVKAIGGAKGRAVKPSSVWEAIQDSAAWQAIVVIATVVLTIVSIVAIFVGGPLVWAIIAAATVLLMVNALMSIAQGKNAWLELGLLAVGLIPGGRLLAMAGTAGHAAIAAMAVTRIGERIAPVVTRAAGAIKAGASLIRSGVHDLRLTRTVDVALSGDRAIPEGFEEVVTMFNMKTANIIMNSAVPTIGRAGDVAWLAPASDVERLVRSPMDAMIQSGAAPQVTDAFMNNEPIFALFAKSDRLNLHVPTELTPGASENFVAGGHTAIVVDGEAMVNEMREMIAEGGTPVQVGDRLRVLFEDADGWAWKTLHTF